MQMDIHEFRNSLRRNGYGTEAGYMDSSTSTVLWELFSDLCTVVAIVGHVDPEAPLRQKGSFLGPRGFKHGGPIVQELSDYEISKHTFYTVSELKKLHESSNACDRYNLRSKDHFSNYPVEVKQSTSKNMEQNVNYQSMIERNLKLEEQNREQKLELDKTVEKLHEAVNKAKNYATRITEFESDFKDLKSYSDKMEQQIANNEERVVKNGKQWVSAEIEKGLTVEIDRLRIKIGELEQHGWKAANCDTQEIITSQQNEIDGLKEKQKTDFVPKGKYDTLEKDRDQLRSRLDNFGKEIADKNAKIHEMNEQIASNKKCLNSSGPKRTDEELKTERNQLQIQVDSFRKQIEEKNGQLLAYHKEIDSNLESYHMSFDKMQKSNDQRIIELRREVTKKEIQLIELKDNFNKITNKLEAAEIRLFNQKCKHCHRVVWPDRHFVNMDRRGPPHANKHWSEDTNSYSRSGGELSNLMDVDNVEPYGGANTKDKNK